MSDAEILDASVQLIGSVMACSWQEVDCETCRRDVITFAYDMRRDGEEKPRAALEFVRDGLQHLYAHGCDDHKTCETCAQIRHLTQYIDAATAPAAPAIAPASPGHIPEKP